MAVRAATCDNCLTAAYDAGIGRNADSVHTARLRQQERACREIGDHFPDHYCEGNCPCACPKRDGSPGQCDDPGAHRPGCKCDGGEPLL